MDEVKRWELAQLPGFERTEGPEEDDDYEDAEGDEERKSEISKMEFDDEGNIIHTPIKKKPKIISFDSPELNKYLMSKEIQDILKEENLPNRSSFKTEKSSLDLTKKYYNKAEKRINNLKEDFNPSAIKVVYEDGRNVAYPVKQNIHKKTQEKN